MVGDWSVLAAVRAKSNQSAWFNYWLTDGATSKWGAIKTCGKKATKTHCYTPTNASPAHLCRCLAFSFPLCNTKRRETEKKQQHCLFERQFLMQTHYTRPLCNRSNILLNFEQSFCLLTSQANRKRKIAPKRSTRPRFYDYNYTAVPVHHYPVIRWRVCAA